MFEHSLENVKKQFKQSFILFLISFALCIILWIIYYKCLSNVNINAMWLVCFYGPIMAILIILSVFAIIKIIFGAVVYHAERTSKNK